VDGEVAVDGSAGRPGAPRPTLRQVAARSGVSLKTASRALNGHPHVTPRTLDKVRTAADELGFRLNGIARELRSGAASVGLVLGDVADPFHALIARGAERELRARGLQLVTTSTDGIPEVERAVAGELVERRVRALLVVPSSPDQAYLEVERRHGLPVVMLDRPPAGLDTDTVVLDNRAGARAAAEHLVAAGHRRVGLIGDGRLTTHRERIAGVTDALRAAGVPDPERHVRSGAPGAGSAEAAARELLDRPDPPTALFAASRRTTAGVLRALRDSGRDVALVGFDDFDLADLLGISVVAHDPEEMGRRAAEIALARLDGDDAAPRTVVLPTWLVPRGSGERPPA
jgi:LacI family transcriptional regulator